MVQSRRGFLGSIAAFLGLTAACSASSAQTVTSGLREIGKLPTPLQGAWVIDDRVIFLADGSIFELSPDGLEYVATMAEVESDPRMEMIWSQPSGGTAFIYLTNAI